MNTESSCEKFVGKFVYICFASLRLIVIVFNEIVVIFVIFSTDLSKEKGLGLIVNFSGALIICELDDIVMTTGRI